jgi:hypothetical protein
MKILWAALLAAACAQVAAQGGAPAVPRPPASARVIPDTCVGASCPKLITPGAPAEPCLGVGCANAGRPPGPPAPPSSGPSRQPGWVSPAPSRLPPPPPPRGVPSGPLTPAPPLPVPR